MAELTPKTIDELTSANAPNDGDIFPFSRSGGSRKITWAAIKSALPSLGSLGAEQGTISGGTAQNFSIADYARGMIVLSSAASSKMDIVVYYGRSGSSVMFKKFSDTSDLSVTSRTNTLTITPTSGASVFYLHLTWV